MDILPPDTPDDLYPLPWPQRPLTVFGLNTKQIQSFTDAGVENLGTLEIWLEHHKPSELAGVGPKTESDILEGFESLKKTKKFARLL